MSCLEVLMEVRKFVSPVYLVGGSVRDTLLGEEAKDYDFATPLTPDEVESFVRRAGKRPNLIGKRFGTVAFKVNGVLVEVTTFRTEVYNGSRKPEVTFTKNLTSDLARRDFTVNAMAMALPSRIIDPFNGQKDLGVKLIKAVGNPTVRFREDPLRLLRACGFASQLGFTVESQTFSSMERNAHKVLEISRERWVLEMDKILLSNQATVGLECMADTGLLKYVLPELAVQVSYDQNSPYHCLTLWKHTVKAVNLAPPDLNLRWALLLHDVGKPVARKVNKRGYSNYVHHQKIGAELVDKNARYLRWPNERRENVVDLVKNHLEENSPLREYDSKARF